jgi:uncharacterized damage-inducible protein DinB
MTLLEYFRGLVPVESGATARALDSLATVPAAARSAPAYARALGVMAHNELARKVWMWRLTDVPYDTIPDWFPVVDIERTRAEALERDRDWTRYLASLSEGDLDRRLEYTASDGRRFSSAVHEVIAHVFNHSTYHRGQVARIVHELGGQRAATDMIALTRRTH